jgi:hypothetical protein
VRVGRRRRLENKFVHEFALILAQASGSQQAQNHVIFLENIFDELREAPVGK